MSAEKVQAIATEFNSDYPTVLSGLLDKIEGLTAEEKTAIMDGVQNKQPLIGVGELNLDTVIQEQSKRADYMVEENELLLLEQIKKAQEKEQLENYDPQEAKEGFVVSEVKVSSKAPVKDQEDFNYNPFKQQNIIKMVIDKAKNIFSKNKETGQIDMIHGKSGSYVRIDGEGNVTEYVTGDYKRVILGNMVEEVRGSKSVKVKGDNFLTVQGKNEQDVSATNTEQSGGVTSIKGANIQLN